MSALRSHTPTCPKCGGDLYRHGDVTLANWVDAASDPDGKTRLDLILDCEACDTKFNAFVALDEFVAVDVA